MYSVISVTPPPLVRLWYNANTNRPPLQLHRVLHNRGIFLLHSWAVLNMTTIQFMLVFVMSSYRNAFACSSTLLSNLLLHKHKALRACLTFNSSLLCRPPSLEQSKRQGRPSIVIPGQWSDSIDILAEQKH